MLNAETYASATCSQTDPETWFPEPGQRDLTRMAKKMCSECVVLEQCTIDTLANPHQFGIRAGLSVADLRKLKRGA